MCGSPSTLISPFSSSFTSRTSCPTSSTSLRFVANLCTPPKRVWTLLTRPTPSHILHKFGRVFWLKLRRDNSVMDSDLKIAAVNANPMAIGEIGSDEERRTRLRTKKETLGMDGTVEVLPTRGPKDYEARDSRDPVAHPVETSIAQRTAPDLVLWSDELGRLLEPAQEERKARGRSVQLVQIQLRRLRTSSRIRVSVTGAGTACEPELLTIHITDNHTKSQSSRSSWRTTAWCRMHLAVNCSRSWTCPMLLSA